MTHSGDCSTSHAHHGSEPEDPSTHMWGFSIQRELPKKMVLELNYLGRHDQNLFGGYDGDAHDIWKNGFLDAFNQLKATGTSALSDQLLAGYSSTKTGSEYVLSNSTTKNYIRRNSVAQLSQWRNYFRLPRNWNLDMAIAKKIKITSDGNHELELRLDMQNVTNSVVYDKTS